MSGRRDSIARELDTLLLSVGWKRADLGPEAAQASFVELVAKTGGRTQGAGASLNARRIESLWGLLATFYLRQRYDELLTMAGWQLGFAGEDPATRAEFLEKLCNRSRGKPMASGEFQRWAVKNLQVLIVRTFASQHYDELLVDAGADTSGDSDSQARKDFLRGVERFAKKHRLSIGDRLSAWLSRLLRQFFDIRREIRALFEKGNSHPEFLERTKRCLSPRFQSSANDCIGFIFETLLRRALAFDSRDGTLKAWVIGSIAVDGVVGEWLKSEHGAGGALHEAIDLDAGNFGIESLPGGALPGGDSASHRKFHEYLAKHLRPQWKALFELLYEEGLESLEAALRLGEEPNFEKILCHVAKRWNPHGPSKLRTKMDDLAEMLDRAGISMRHGESEEAYGKRAFGQITIASNGGLMAPDLQTAIRLLRDLGNDQIAARVRKQLERMHESLRALIKADPRAMEIVRDILACAAERGVAQPQTPVEDSNPFWDEDQEIPPDDQEDGSQDDNDPDEDDLDAGEDSLSGE